MLAGALVRSIRSESNRESQVGVEAGSGRLRPSPSRLPLGTLSLSPQSPSLLPFSNERVCLAPSPLFSPLSRCRSLTESFVLFAPAQLSLPHGPTGYIFPTLSLGSSSFARLFLPLPPHLTLLFLSFGRRIPTVGQSIFLLDSLSFVRSFVRCRLDDETKRGLLPARRSKVFSRACAVRAPFQPRRSCGERGN